MKNNKNNKFVQAPDSFLEAFRGIGSDVVSTTKNSVLKEGAKDIFKSFSPLGNQLPQESISEKESDFYPNEGLRNNVEQKRQKIEIIHRQEQTLFTSEQKEIARQVGLLQEDIQKLAKATSQLTSEVREAEMTVMQTSTTSGKYHILFLIRIREIIGKLRSQIQESSFWLASWNKKAKKKNHYWSQFKKSGSKFMLSADRYMATQAG